MDLITKKISELPAAGLLDGTELLEVVKNATNKQTSLADIRGVVQTTGQSTTKVMSQKAVTDLIGDADNSVSSAVAAALASKVDKVTGKQLSDENYTTADKDKLRDIVDGVLQQDLANPDKGAAMVAYKDGTVAEKIEYLTDRELYFSEYIKVMDGAADNTAEFLSALTHAAGRRIVLNSGEIIRVTAPVDAGNIPVNIYGIGGVIRFDHDDYGILTTGNVTLDGDLTISGMNRAHRALEMLGGRGKFVKIMDGVHFENFFGADSCMVVRTACAYNYIKASFNRLRCYQPADADAAPPTGIVRAVYIGGSGSYTVFDNIRVTDCNNVDRDTGEITCFGADAIQCQNGVHFIEFISGEFNDVGKRWLKLQGNAGSKTVIHSITGSSSFVGTPDTIESAHNGMYACVSVQGGDLEIKSLTLRGGACLFALSVGYVAGRVLVNGLNYTPEYKKYVVGINTRTIFVESTGANAEVEWGSGYSKNTWNGVESYPTNPRVTLSNVKMEVYNEAVITRAKALQVNNTNLVAIAPGGRFAIQVPKFTKQVSIQNNNIEGEFMDGVLLTSGRTEGLQGSISGNTAESITGRVLNDYDRTYTTQLAIGTNFGPGTSNTQQAATQHTFRNKEGTGQMTISDSGVSLKPLQASATSLGNTTHPINVNKFTFQCVYNTTSKKLMVAQADGTWISVDGVDVITPT